ncbi:MAG: flippase-like domain-containing protein [Candidatus Binatia bacterium]|nr:flippase-like domain-containing protein [Candidatus Binatia bacterium]
MANGLQTPPLWSRWWFKAGISAAVLALLFYKVDTRELGAALKEIDGVWLGAALGTYLLSMVVSCVRWTMLARPLGFNQPYSHFFGSYFTGMYMNLFGVSTVAGDIGRALFLAGGPGRRALALTTVLADRGLGFVVLVWIGAGAIIFQPQYKMPLPLYWSAWLVPPITLLGWLFGPQLAVRVLPPGNRWRRMVEVDLVPYWNDAKLLLVTSLVAAVFHTLQIVSQVFLGLGLGLKLPWSYYFIFVPVVNIAGMAPVTFSGIGIREAGYIFFLHRMRVDQHAAMALGLLASAIVLASGLVGGLVYLFWSGPQRPAAETVENAEAVPTRRGGSAVG